VFWNMEENINARLPPNTRSIPKFPFFSAFLHLNAAMWHGNNALTPDPTKVDELTSPPSYWPLLTKGIRMTSWAEAGPRMYMLGNPAVWWGGLFALVMWIIVVFLHDILIRRNNHSFAGLLFSTEEEWNNFYVNGRLLFLGWLFHYTPFFIMARVTYLHHYVPAVLFLALFSGLMADYATAVIRYLKPSGKKVFYFFSPPYNYLFITGFQSRAEYLVLHSQRTSTHHLTRCRHLPSHRRRRLCDLLPDLLRNARPLRRLCQPAVGLYMASYLKLATVTWF